MTHRITKCVLAIIFTAGLSTSLSAADAPADKDKKARQELRQELKSLPPEQRAARVRELRKQHRDEAKKAEAAPADKNDANLKQRREKLEERYAELKKKEKAGTLTDKEKQQLEKLTVFHERLEKTAKGDDVQKQRKKPADGQPRERKKKQKADDNK